MTDKMFNDIIDSIINNATDDEIEIIREKLNNHIINHIYDGEVHKELSDEFDSSFCPHCGHDHIIKYGKDKNGNQRCCSVAIPGLFICFCTNIDGICFIVHAIQYLFTV